MNEQEIFCEAIGYAAAGEREIFVTRVCGADHKLRQRVNALLQAHDRDSGFLEQPVLEGVRDRVQAVLEQSEPAASEETVDHAQRVCADLRRQDEDVRREALHFLEPSEQPGSLGRLGHYDIQDVIGRGGCGIVLRGHDAKLHRSVAIKIIAPELAMTSPARKRFLREARATAAVTDQHVVRIYAVEEQPRPYLVMEFIAGETLQEKLDQTGPFTVEEINRWGLQIAQGLAASHAQGLVHRDIKPSNVLIERGTDLVKITDFGLARTVDDASLTQSGMISGTPLYMSPEQSQGLSVDQRTDLFSLGSVLYAMCTGRPPFRASSAVAILRRVVEDQPRPVQEIITEIPAWLVAIISRLHAKNPDDRFQSAEELVKQWRACQFKEPQNVVALDTHAIDTLARANRKGKFLDYAAPQVQTRGTAAKAKAAVAILALVVLATIAYFTMIERVPRGASMDVPLASDFLAAGSTASGAGTVIEPAPSALADFREIHGADEEGVKAWAASLPPGYRPTWVSPRRNVEPFVFDAIAPRLGTPEVDCLAHFIRDDWNGASRQEYEKYNPTHRMIFRAMFGESAVLLWNADDDEDSYWYSTQSFVDDKIIENMKYERQRGGVYQRYLPVSLNVVHREESVYYEVVLTWQPYTDCVWHWSLTAEQLKQRVKHYGEKGWSPHLIGMHANSDEPLFTAAFVIGDRMAPWACSIDINEAEYEASLVSRKSAGMRPRCIASWVQGGAVHYAVVWNGEAR